MQLTCCFCCVLRASWWQHLLGLPSTLVDCSLYPALAVVGCLYLWSVHYQSFMFDTLRYHLRAACLCCTAVRVVSFGMCDYQD
jgi:hypothetical protein